VRTALAGDASCDASRDVMRGLQLFAILINAVPQLAARRITAKR